MRVALLIAARAAAGASLISVCEPLVPARQAEDYSVQKMASGFGDTKVEVIPGDFGKRERFSAMAKLTKRPQAH